VRFVTGRRAWGGVILALGVSQVACSLAGGTGAAGPLPPAVIAPGAISRAEQSEALQLMRSAETSFEARRFPEVVRTTEELTQRFPSADVSGAALLLEARAELEMGSGDQADSTAARYLALLRPGDPRATAARLLQVRALSADPSRQLDRLLRIDSTATAQEIGAAAPIARAAADSLTADELEAVLAAVPEPGPLAPIAQVRHAVNLLDRGDSLGASAVATAAIQGGAVAPELEMAEGVLRGELPPERRRATTFSIAAVLPVGGPPGLAEFARLVGEGVEVAAATVLGEPFQVTLVPLDDQGDPVAAAGFVGQLEAEGVAGVVGFLEDEALVSAGLSRQRELPIVSPTARSAAAAGEGVYSLEGADPQAAQTVARYAASRALQRVAILYPEGSPTAAEEADAFQAEAERLGVLVVGRFLYPPQATFFETQILGAQNALRATEIAALGLAPEDTLRVEMLEPVGLFMPIPPEDVEYVAPQIAHFALDTLAIEPLGTSGWTDPQVLAALDPLYFDGVVATAPAGREPGSPGQLRFREAYETYFQRTLVSSTPAIGYDATLLLLEALRAGRLAPADVRASFQNLRDIEGATGVFSVTDDRVVRRTELVRIDNGRLVPIVY
jgi:ABC-type branched-subunit amino acid transport system substrate-binding protein